MKSTLSFWQRVYNGLSWVGRGLKMFWMVAFYFEISPSERRLLISYWYDYRHYRKIRPKDSIDTFLDIRVQDIKRLLAKPNLSVKSRQLNGDLLEALRSKRIRATFIEFLKSPSPKENCGPMIAAIRSAWRIEDGDEDCGLEMLENDSAGNVGRLLNAKAYVIAAQLWFELEGDENEFESLSRRVADLRSFIREKFGVEKLPGRLEEFKGYSYKTALKDKNSARRGQLRMPFRQIMEHPEVFGESVAERAREILDKHFT